MPSSAVLDWDDLRFFLGVLRAGSQNAAARRLGADQTTVGRRIASLEADLGAQLLIRTSRGFVLTQAGEAIRASAERVEEAVLALELEAAAVDTRLVGTVKIATTDALARGFVVPALAALHARHPEVRVTLVTAPATVKIERREADFAIRTVRPTSPGLVARKLGAVVQRLYASRDYLEARPRARRGKFAAHDWLVMDPAIMPSQATALLGQSLADGQVVLQANNVVSLLHAATAGLGVALLPTYLADREPSLLRLRSDLEERLTVWLVVPGDTRPASRVRAVMDAVIVAFAR